MGKGRPRSTPVCTQYWAQGHRYDESGLCKCGFNRANATRKAQPSKPVRVGLDQIAELEKIAAESNTTVTELVREALSDLIARRLAF